MSKESISRRQFLRGSCATALALGGLSVTTTAHAGEKLSEDDPTAQALGYKHDATKVDITKYPKRADEAGKKQLCNNCALYVKQEEGDWAPCTLFQNKLVAGKGWCSAWITAG